MANKGVQESDGFLEEIEARDAEARAIRERAVEYAERVANGEEPWKEDQAWKDEQKNVPTVEDQLEAAAAPVSERPEVTGGDTEDDGA